ncbi:MAG: hypothetical protein AAF405_07055, partial [Pseudomonadota bacterium]
AVASVRGGKPANWTPDIVLEHTTLYRNFATGGAINTPPGFNVDVKSSILAYNYAGRLRSGEGDDLSAPYAPVPQNWRVSRMDEHCHGGKLTLHGANFVTLQGAVPWGCAIDEEGLANNLYDGAAAEARYPFGHDVDTGPVWRAFSTMAGKKWQPVGAPVIVDAADECPDAATDAFGTKRPQDGDGDDKPGCDIGAVELQPEKPEPQAAES